MRQKTIESKRFYGTLSLASGKRKRTPLTDDQKTSETLLRRLQSEEDTKRALGITEFDERRSRPIIDALEEYVSYLSMKGNTDEYVHTCDQRLRKLFKTMRTTTLSDMDSGTVLKTLNRW